ncbi:MAG: 2OG-Fe(II) oxygenase [Myxococcales bacterium]|nr:2OG-Fe(II) oxygenase [Myxococcales bacterium]
MLDDPALDALAAEGWCVIDGFVGPEAVEDARLAAEALDAAGRLTPAGLSRGADHRQDEAIRGDRTVWLTPDTPPAFLPVATRFEALRRQLNREAYLGLARCELQLAHYPGDGARYVRHRDAFAGSINRKITAVWYLNSGWTLAAGGALRLFVPGEPRVEPVADRLVVFFSELVEHAVEPAFAPRWALTGWMRKRDPRRPAL